MFINLSTKSHILNFFIPLVIFFFTSLHHNSVCSSVLQLISQWLCWLKGMEMGMDSDKPYRPTPPLEIGGLVCCWWRLSLAPSIPYLLMLCITHTLPPPYVQPRTLGLLLLDFTTLSPENRGLANYNSTKSAFVICYPQAIAFFAPDNSQKGYHS